MPARRRGGTVNVAFLGAVNLQGGDGATVALLLAIGPAVVALAGHLWRLITRIPPVTGHARRWSLPDDRCDLLPATVGWAMPAPPTVGAVAPARAPPTFRPPFDPAAAFRR